MSQQHETQQDKNNRYWGFFLLAGALCLLAIGVYALFGAFGELVLGGGTAIMILRALTGGQ